MVHTEYNQHKFAIFQIMTPYSTHSVTLEFPTYSLVHNSLSTHERYPGTVVTCLQVPGFVIKDNYKISQPQMY